MKKITLFIALLCSFSAFSTRYLVQGSLGTNTWRAAGTGEEKVILPSDFSSWYNSTAFSIDGNDEIWVAGGTYIINSSFGRKKVSVYGGFAGTETTVSGRSKVSGGKVWEFSNPTIMDGNNTCPQGFSNLDNAISPVNYIDGLTITKCEVTNVTASVSGVGAFVTLGCIMQNCIISNNKYNNTATANSYVCRGAGIYMYGGTLIDSYVVGNSAIKGNGAAAFGGGIAFNYISGVPNVVKGCTIENNTATNGGGGLQIMSGTQGVIEDCIFKTNSSTGNGGGIGSYGAQGGSESFALKNCQFIENTSSAMGGGAELLLSATSSITVDGCSFIGNTGVNVGGLICRASGGYLPITNCIFRDNKSTNSSASGVATSAFYSGVPNMTLLNCIFANNSSTANPNNNYAVTLGAGVSKLLNCDIVNNLDAGEKGYSLNMNGQAGSITNCVFWGNTNVSNIIGITASSLISTYNATTEDKNTTGSLEASTEGNITTLTATNTFESPTTFIGVPANDVEKDASAVADWRLKDTSPAVDAGLDLTLSGVTTSIDGESRPLGDAFDMGAYETSKPTGLKKLFEYTNFCYSSNQGIEVSGLNNGEIVMVYGVSGNLVFKQKVKQFNFSISVPKGVYLVRATDKVNKVVVK